MTETWRLTLITVPIALVLWLCAAAAMRLGGPGWSLFVLFYAPLALLSAKVAVAAGLLLHLTYAMCGDAVRARRVGAGWLVALAVGHYACVALAVVGPRGPDPAEAIGSAGAWLAGGAALFVGWQGLVAVGALRRPSRARAR